MALKNIFKTLLILVLINQAAIAWADVRLPELFGNGMVLQRHQKIAVWGWAAPHEKVSVSLKGKTRTTTADTAGKWFLKLDEEPAGGPYTLEVIGQNKIQFTDVLIGEVWLCSGQSNMAFVLKGVKNAKQELKDVDYPMIRHFTVPRSTAVSPKDRFDKSVSWQVSNADNAPDFTAVGFLFAKELYKKLGVPVGIIHASWGGTIIETWMSKTSLEHTKGCESLMQDFNALPKEILQTAKPRDCPTLLFNAMIHPLIPYSLKGVLWYQGENNGYWGYQYRNLLLSMVKDWRKQWNNKKLSFYVTQISSYSSERLKKDGGTSWAELRASQQCITKLAHTGLAVTYDLGDSTDIHPLNKQDVSKRLAALALYYDYAQDIAYTGPTLKKIHKKGRKIEISFEHIAGGLGTRGNHPDVKGFEIAGKDSIFVPANAQIIGNKVIVHHPRIEAPIAVRYAWRDETSASNLINTDGFPAFPFRTDSFPPSTRSHLLEKVEIQESNN